MEKYYFTFSKELNGALEKEIEHEGSKNPAAHKGSRSGAAQLKKTKLIRAAQEADPSKDEEKYHLKILLSADGGIKPIKGSGDSLRFIESLEISASDSTLSVALVVIDSDIDLHGKTTLEQESGNFANLLDAVIHSEELVIQGTDFFTIRSGSTDITYVDTDIEGIVIKVTYKDEGKLSSGRPLTPAR